MNHAENLLDEIIEKYYNSEFDRNNTPVLMDEIVPMEFELQSIILIEIGHDNAITESIESIITELYKELK